MDLGLGDRVAIVAAASRGLGKACAMALAREVARKGVTVNSVSPGYCRTAMVMSIPDNIREQIISQIPVGRIGEPDDIARAILFMCEQTGNANAARVHIYATSEGF